MATRTPKRIISGNQVDASNETLYTAPTSTKCIITKLTFSNNTGSDRTITVYLVPSGSSAGNDNKLIDAKTVKANDVYVCYQAEGHVLEAGGQIIAVASAATAITAIGSGIEIT